MKHLSVTLILSLAFVLSGYAAEEEKKAETPPTPGAPDDPKKETDPKAIVGQMPQYPIQSDYFKDVADQYDDEVEAQKIEFRPMLDILDALRATPQNELHKLKTELTYKQLMKDPQDFRGQIVKLTGVLHQVKQKIVPENRTGITKAWQGQIANAQRQIITFVTIEPLPEDVKVGKAVDLTGIFMKRLAYLNDAPGDKLTWCPLVFVRRAERNADFDKPQQSTGNPMLDIIGAMVFLAVGGGCVFYFWGRQKSKNARNNYFTQLKEERAGGDYLFPGPKPPPKTVKPKVGVKSKEPAAAAAETAVKPAETPGGDAKPPAAEGSAAAPEPEKKE